MTITSLEIAGTQVQGSLEWRRARLGWFTASSIANLMSTGRGKAETWGEKAITEMAEVAAERELARDVVEDDERLREVLDLQCRENAAMRHGKDWEATARSRYEIERGVSVETCGLLAHPLVARLGYSPDGCVVDQRGTIRGLIEVKCPSTLKTWMRYRWNVRDGASLKREKPEYYWQVQAGMSVTGARWADMVLFCPWVVDGTIIVRVERDEADIRALEARVDAANDFILQHSGRETAPAAEPSDSVNISETLTIEE